MDGAFNQIELLAQYLQSKDHTMIDPVEFGEIKGAVASLQSQVADIRQRQTAIDQKLDLVLDKLAEARGGWKVLMLLGGAAGSLGAGISWVAANWKG